MTSAAALFAKLSATAEVTDLVGDRIYPVRPEQGAAAPYIIFQQIGGDPGNTHNEAAGATIRMFQFACFALTFEDANALRDLVIAALDNADLENGDSPSLDDERDADFEESANVYRADADFSV